VVGGRKKRKGEAASGIIKRERDSRERRVKKRGRSHSSIRRSLTRRNSGGKKKNGGKKRSCCSSLLLPNGEKNRASLNPSRFDSFREKKAERKQKKGRHLSRSGVATMVKKKRAQAAEKAGISPRPLAERRQGKKGRNPRLPLGANTLRGKRPFKRH